jgi:hypothetical protein
LLSGTSSVSGTSTSSISISICISICASPIMATRW